MTADSDPTWQPTDVIQPGTCPPHLDRAMRQAIADAKAAREADEQKRRERQESQ